MQPLTPAERHIIQKLVDRISKSEFADADFWAGEDEVIDSNIGNRELWLKVLTMALECNEMLQKEWNKNPTGRQSI